MRKTIIAIVAFLLLGLVFSCRQHQYPHILMTADSLCEAKPDSAVSLLRSLKPQFATASKADQMYYQLLCIKANNKNYHVFTSDSSIMPLVQYYEQHESDRHLAETYYLAGQIYFDMKDAPQALDYYQRAADAITKNTDSDTKILIYYQMADLFVYQRLKNEAIASYRKSLEYCKEAKDTTRMLYVLRDLAFALEDNDMFEEALRTYNEALSLANEIRNMDMVLRVKAHLASYYDDRKEHKRALSMIREVLHNELKQNFSSTYSIASAIYEHCGILDSALFCYQKMFEGDEIYAKREAAKHLAEHNLELYKFEKAYSYLIVFDVLSDSIRKMDAAKTIAEMNAAFNFSRFVKENNRLTISNKNKIIVIIVILLVGSVIVSTLVVLWMINRRKRLLLQTGLEKLKKLKDAERNKSMEQIEKNKQEIERLRECLFQTDIETESLRQQLQEKEKRLSHVVALAEIEHQRYNDAKERLAKAGIIRIINRVASEGSALNDNLWKNLDEEVNTCFPQFRENLYSLFVPSKHEYHIVLLMKAGLSTINIATLTYRSKQAISTAKSRMYQKAFGKKGKAEEWDGIIDKL